MLKIHDLLTYPWLRRRSFHHETKVWLLSFIGKPLFLGNWESRQESGAFSVIGIDSLSLSLRYSSKEDLPFEEETSCRFEEISSFRECCRFTLDFKRYYAIFDHSFLTIVDSADLLCVSIDLKDDFNENMEETCEMLEIEEGKAAGMILFLRHFFFSGMKELYE